jgi:hypothetical protein
MKFETSINGSHLTTAERDALPAAIGDMIFNVDVDQYQFYNGVKWSPVGSSFGDLWAANTLNNC